MRIVRDGQRYHPMCDPTDEHWWPEHERAAYLTTRTAAATSGREGQVP
jgi:hypothetical protein